CDAEGDGVGGVQARAELARRLVEVDAADESVGPAGDAARLAAQHEVDPGLAALADATLARSLLLTGRGGAARRHAERGLATARGAHEAGLEVEALATVAFLDEIDGDRDAAAE